MSDLTGSTISSTYNLLLTTESAVMGSSLQSIQSGTGVSSALQLSTTDVNVAGDLGVDGSWSLNADGTGSWGENDDAGAFTWDAGKAIINAQGSNSLVLKPNAADGITIDSSGNVGIGGTPSTYNLEVHDSSDSTISVVAGATSKASLYLGDAVATRGRVEYDNDEGGSTPDSLSLWSNNARAITIDNEQNVGIGDAPSTYPLEVIGSNGVGAVVRDTTDATDTYSQLELHSSTTKWRILGYGPSYTDYESKFSIWGGATGSQDHRLTIDSLGNVTVPTGNISSYTYGTATTGEGFRIGATEIYGQTSATDKVKISVNGDSYFNGGNVGIGGTASQKLTVIDAAPTILNSSTAGDSRFYAYADGGDAYMRMTTVSGVSNDWAIGTDRTDGYFKIADNSTLGTNDRLTIDSSGRLLVGTTTPPSSTNTLLAVHCPISSSNADVIQISQNTTGADKAAASFGIVVQNGGEATNAADLVFNTASGGSLSERMRIDSSGNVGIGTGTALTATGAKLHIEESSSGALVTPLKLINPNQAVDSAVAIDFKLSADSVSAAVQLKAISPTTGVDGDFVISTRESGVGLAERMRIDSSGVATLTNSNSGLVIKNSGASDKEWRVGGGSASQFQITEVGVADQFIVNAGGQVIMPNLPTADPEVAGALYSDGATSAGVPKALMVSGGAA